MPNPFHLAIPVHDLTSAREFYGKVIGCEEGRSSDHWIDFNLFGHQLVCHLSESAKPAAATNPVDGHDVPIPHFGVVLTMEDWKVFRDRLIDRQIKFDIEPHIRFPDQAGEQATLFFRDPSGNALEFKAFRDIERELFKREQPQREGLLLNSELFRLSGAVKHSPAIDEWLSGDPADLYAIARIWFRAIRTCGEAVTELLHDGCPVACVEGVPFAYVNVFKVHVNVGFFLGASLDDPKELLEGSGKRMRHVKLKPGTDIDTEALQQLIDQSYTLVKAKL